MIEIHNILDVRKHIEGIEGVIFDLDDTLYSEKEYVRSGYKRLAEHFNKPEMYKKLWDVFLRGCQPIDEVFKWYGISDQKAEALQIYRFQEPEISLYPGVAELISQLRKTRKVGIITDGRPEGQRAKLKALQIDVDEMIITDELGGVEFRKPNIKAFELMKKRLELSYEKMCYVGDNTKKDFVAPENLGMKSIFFKNQDGLYVY